MRKLLLYIAILLSCALSLRAQETVSSPDPATLSVAERNAAQGFNDTIDRLAPDFVTVGLVIADPGDILYSVLGHASLHLQCPVFGMDYIYTYESESVQGKVFRFLMNDLNMGMMAIEPSEFLQTYIEEGRGVREYRLNLPPEVKTELWRMCDERLEQGVNMEYDPVKRGCAISSMHSVEDAVKSANAMTGRHYRIDYPRWGDSFDRTLREIFYDNAPHGWGLFWCMTIVGGIVDKPHLPRKEKLICPQELADTWRQCTIDGKPMISEPALVLTEGAPLPPEKFTPLHAALLLLLLALLGCWIRYPYTDWLILGIQTAFGCAVVWLWLMPLPATGWSWLVIPFNPLPLVFWKWRRYWSLEYAILIVVWGVAMLLAPHRLVEYAHIILALSFAVVLLKQRFTISR